MFTMSVTTQPHGTLAYNDSAIDSAVLTSQAPNADGSLGQVVALLSVRP